MAVKKINKISKIENEGLSYDTKTILVVVTLILAYPVGLILMMMWMKWPAWLKILVAVPMAFGLLVLVLTVLLVTLGLGGGRPIIN